MAWSKRYLVGVWVGHPDERPMTALSGYRIAAKLAQRVLDRLHAGQTDGLEAVEFPPPRGWRSVQLCAVSGGAATPACDRVALEWLPPERIAEPCAVHRRGERGTEIALPSRFTNWLASLGLENGADGAPASAVLAGLGAPARIQIVSPEPGARLLRDPETPAEESTLALRAEVDARVEQIVWYVDGRPFRTVEAPFEARWELVPGEHSFQARQPFTNARSAAVKVRID
jgi:penicillin-binding protein 1C